MSKLQRYANQELLEKADDLISKFNLGLIAENIFHSVEVDLVQEFHKHLVNLTSEIYQLIESGDEILIEDKYDALILRYVIVPITYRLGYSKLGSEFQQQTFTYLFSEIDQMISDKLHEFFGELNVLNKVISEFDYRQYADVWKFFSRVKSNHSIWKKVKSIEQIRAMDKSEFAQKVHDYIGLTYAMRLPSEGNRYDALVNGVRIVELKDSVLSYRNQFCRAKSGEFELEPIVKFKIQHEGIPAELQIHGGLIFGFMAGSIYYAYKNFDYDHIKESLSKDQWYKRLQKCIDLYENDDENGFHKLMLMELVEGNRDYGTKLYIPDNKPKLEPNLNYILPGSNRPAWELDEFIF
jgi:hypothetical protein